MGIGKKIKAARMERKLTQEELARALGVTKSAVANYESDVSHPKETVLYRLFSVLQVDANYLFQEMLNPALLAGSSLSDPKEQSHLQKYRSLSAYSKETIDYLIDRELAKAQSAAVAESLAKPEAELSKPLFDTVIEPLFKSETALRLYPYLHHIASAGSGSYNDDIPTEKIEAAYCPHADFIIGVNGDSMEPLYQEGDLLYVEKTDDLRLGEIGIFSKGDSIYVKELGKNRLHSLNKAFPDIYPDSEPITTIGRVLGRVER